MVVKIEGSTRNTRNTAPFKPRTDEILALCHPYTEEEEVVFTRGLHS